MLTSFALIGTIKKLSFGNTLLFQTLGLQSIKERTGRANRPHLKHIMQQCYNKSVDDPNELNHYEPFTPEVRPFLTQDQFDNLI